MLNVRNSNGIEYKNCNFGLRIKAWRIQRIGWKPYFKTKERFELGL